MLQILWWSSGADIYSQDGILESHKEAVFSILTSNSDILRQSQTDCFTPTNHNAIFDSSDKCSAFRYHASLKRRTHVSYISSDVHISYDSHDVSLLTQMSLDRFDTFETMAQNWQGPISVACHVAEEEADKLLNMVLQSSILKNRQNVEYHIVYKRDVSTTIFSNQYFAQQHSKSQDLINNYEIGISD